MSYLAKVALCATALCAPLLFAPISAQAVPAGAKSLPRIHGAVLVKRGCIAYETDEGNRGGVIGGRGGPTCADPRRPSLGPNRRFFATACIASIGIVDQAHDRHHVGDPAAR